MKIVICREDSPLVEAIKIWQGVYLGEFFPNGAEMIKFLKHCSETYSSETAKFNGLQATAVFIGK